MFVWRASQSRISQRGHRSGGLWSQYPCDRRLSLDKGRLSEIMEIIMTHFPEGFMKQIMVTDSLSAYFVIETENHQICLAHLLRNLVYLTLLCPECTWPVDMVELIGDTMKRWKQEGFSQHIHDEFKPKLDELMNQDIKADLLEKQEAIVTFRDNLKKKKDYILTFLNTEGVPRLTIMHQNGLFVLSRPNSKSAASSRPWRGRKHTPIFILLYRQRERMVRIHSLLCRLLHY